MPWQDKARVLSEIHKLRQTENPSQTVSDTARELAAKTGANAKGSVSSQRDAVRNAVLLAENLHRPSVAKARNATEALGILLKEENAKIEAELINRKKQKALAEPLAIRVIHGSLIDHIPLIERESVDLIIADPPYGIGADTGGFRARTVEHHNYDDSQETAQALMQAIIVDGFSITKPRANLFMFGDVDLFPLFKVACAKMGWKPFRTPIIWRKSESEGVAPWGREGFRRTYEMIFFATKGQRGLIQSPVDILDEKRVGRSVRRYGPEKPVGLLEQLIECSTLPGDLVLDPCCGSGSTLAACRRLRRKAIGIELDQGAYNLAVVAAERDEIPQESAVEELA
jgi:site-specific DNA-methyltransferase (adenine-specific)